MKLFIYNLLVTPFIDPFLTVFQDLIMERAHDVIHSHAEKEGLDKPMFMYLSLPHTHFPLEAPAKYYDRYPGMDDSEARRSYLAMVSHMDDIVGNMTDALVDSGMYENTIVVMMSDNGGYEGIWPARRMSFYGGSDNGPLRGMKSEYFEGGTRVTTFIHSPLLDHKRFVTYNLETNVHSSIVTVFL